MIIVIIIMIMVIKYLGTFMLTRTTVPLTRSELVRLELHLFAFGPFIIVVGDDMLMLMLMLMIICINQEQRNPPADERDGYAGWVLGPNWSGTFRRNFARLFHLR